jgi:hypothetical protein
MEGFTTCWLTDVYAGNTVEQMLKGKQFNRAVRGSMTCSGTACLISILISVKYLHDQEICFQAVWWKEKLSDVSSWHEQIACDSCYKSRCKFGQIIPIWSRTDRADPNLDCLACCKTPYSTTIRIQTTKRTGFATTGILWRTGVSRPFARSCMFM